MTRNARGGLHSSHARRWRAASRKGLGSTASLVWCHPHTGPSMRALTASYRARACCAPGRSPPGGSRRLPPLCFCPDKLGVPLSLMRVSLCFCLCFCHATAPLIRAPLFATSPMESRLLTMVPETGSEQLVHPGVEPELGTSSSVRGRRVCDVPPFPSSRARPSEITGPAGSVIPH
jgi:hypothetical protein